MLWKKFRDSQVRAWIDAGRGREVPSENPPTPGENPRKKYRAVICTNFQRPSVEKASENFYAGEADSISIRTCLRWGGLHKHGDSGVDIIKTVFLNAPKDEAEPEFLLCSPPRQMVAAGVVAPNVKWRVLGALYGLTSSPRSWSLYRDRQLCQFQWEQDGSTRKLQACVSDPNIWRVIDVAPRKLVALVACYVDDILIVGRREERDAFLAHLKSVWDCSVPEHTESGTVHYCGLEVSACKEGIRITQEKYVQELLQRHPEVTGIAHTPCPSWRDTFDDAERKDEDPNVELIRKVQSLTGELLWLSVRARPEITFPVARMSQLSSRRPQDAIDIGTGVIKFLRSIPAGGIVYGPAPNNTGAVEQFQHTVREGTVQAFSDASHGPSSGRSHQGILIAWAGAPIQWESSRQTMLSLRTAEAELIGLITASQSGEAVSALVGEILDSTPERRLLGDNAASISIAAGPPTAWRTRHLRLRASALRERLECGEWTVQHLVGEHLPADLFTKALPVQRFQSLLPLVGVSGPSPKLAAVREPTSRWTQVAVALWAWSIPQVLKGSALPALPAEDSDSLFGCG